MSKTVADLTTLQQLVRLLADYGPGVALVAADKTAINTTSFIHLTDKAQKVTADLLQHRIGCGEPVGLVAPNSLGWIAKSSRLAMRLR